MRLLHVVPSYLPAMRYGGPIVSVHGLCRALAARGHEVHVFTTNVDGPSESNVPVGVPVDIDGVKVSYFEVPAMRRLYWSPALGRALRARIAEYDVVHSHSVFLWPTWMAERTAHRAGVPYVVSPRGMLVGEMIRRRSTLAKTAWIYLVGRRSLERAAVVHATSELEAEELRHLGWRLSRIMVIPNGVDTPPAVAAQAPAFDVLYLGRISWKKSLDRLIRAIALVPGISLAIAGNDEEGHVDELKRVALNAGAADRVRFLSPAYGEEKWRLMRSARCFALISSSENFGNAALEAMAAGCPVVVAPEVGVAEIVRRCGGGIVADSDPVELARSLAGLLSDPHRLEALGKAAAAVRSEFGWSTIARAAVDLYASLVVARPTGADAEHRGRISS